MSVKLIGVVNYVFDREEFMRALEEAAETALDAAGMQAATYAKRELQKTPSRIDTGLLRNSITWAVSGKPAAIKSYRASKGSNKKNGKRVSASSKNAGSVGVGFYAGTAPADPPENKAVYIGTNVEYAIYVHDGTAHMAPNRFLKNAISNNRGKLLEIMKTTLQNG